MIDDMAVYIANLGKYNEGYLVGAWFTFPIDEEDVKEKIGLNEQYEEYAIHDTDNFPIVFAKISNVNRHIINHKHHLISYSGSSKIPCSVTKNFPCSCKWEA